MSSLSPPHGKDTMRFERFLAAHQLAVVSTVDPRRLIPESALVAYAHTPQLTLYFQTHRQSRKAEHLRVHPYLSLVVGLAESSQGTLQYEGWARPVEDGRLPAVKQMFVERGSPTAREQYLDRPETCFYEVRPLWIGMTDLSQLPARAFELRWPAPQDKPQAQAMFSS